MKVTFDSNVWQPVCNPQDYRGDPSFNHYQKIRNSISTGEITAFLAETTFTLEAFKRVDRQKALAKYNPKPVTSVDEMPDGSIRLRLVYGPDGNAHPGNNLYLSKYLACALPLGFKILSCPRIAGFTNPDIKDEYFVTLNEAESIAKNELFGKILSEIEARNAGVSLIKAIGKKYSTNPRDWKDGIRSAPATEEKAIANAFSEWADGDSIAAHIGYGNTHFCTRDQGKSAGTQSIFAKQNRAWLEQTYNVVLVTPEELSALLA